MDTYTNRVYINRNFSRVPTVTSINNSSMYVNPNFTKRKIYINPNFIQTNNLLENQQNSDSTSISSQFQDISPHFRELIVAPEQYSGENTKSSDNRVLYPSSKSRYKLVRNIDSNLLQIPKLTKEYGTVKINKYKSIPMHNFKKSLQILKDECIATSTKPTMFHKKSNLHAGTKYVSNSPLKLMRLNMASKINFCSKISNKTNFLKLRRISNSSIQKKLKRSNVILKKNNVPCRLFRKFGKCIRNIYGTCEYLHDKKHVSLCRKFLKGICHDEKCLLSHELSSKKMPTCYFYLKGMCTKTDCPYLHVKLSDKSKVCRDFLKGYCEKADSCPNRHVKPYRERNVDLRQLSKISAFVTNSSIEKTILRNKCIVTTQTKQHNVQIERKTNTNKTYEEGRSDTDCRYFKDVQKVQTSICEVIKPTRCKLGVLPSFIQL